MRSRLSQVLSLLLSVTMVFGAGTRPLPVFAQAAATTSNANTPQQSGKTYSQQELDELLAPIALHPDALLAQILMASTYPLDVVEAARWRKANPKIEGSELESQMAGQPWDPSVKSLTAFPTVLDMMSEKLDWTQKLGDAFLGQQKQVMDTVQKLRQKAQQAGSLATTKEQTVSSANEGGTTVIKIEQANPQVVYVPTYNPAVVYGTWWYPAPPPYYYYPPGYVAGAAFFSFAAGVAVGSWLWGGCNWGRGDVNINVNRYNQVNHFDRNNVNNIQNGNWKHNPDRRRGVPYRNEGAQRQFGNAQTRDARARDEFRGRAETGRQDLGQHFDRGTDKRAGVANREGDGPHREGSAQRDVNRGGVENRATLDRRNTPGNRASDFDRSNHSNLGASHRGAAFGDVNSGAHANSFSNRGASSRAGMQGGTHAGGRRR